MAATWALLSTRFSSRIPDEGGEKKHPHSTQPSSMYRYTLLLTATEMAEGAHEDSHTA